MQLKTAPALLLGISLRLFIDKFIKPRDKPNLQDIFLIGAWQGVALVFAFANNQEIAICLAFFAILKLLLDFYAGTAPMTPVWTVLGLALGAAITHMLSSLLDDVFNPPPRPLKTSSALRRERIVQFRRTLDGPDGARERERVLRQTYSDITSLESTSSPLPPHAPRTPKEREVAALRARASLADSERRRCREERKWAIAQGNQARAEQMQNQSKRYSALMQSFHREADTLVVELSNEKEKTPQPYFSQASTSRVVPKVDRVERPERISLPLTQSRQRTTLQSKRSSLRPSIPDRLSRAVVTERSAASERRSLNDSRSRPTVSVDIGPPKRQPTAVHVQVG